MLCGLLGALALIPAPSALAAPGAWTPEFGLSGSSAGTRPVVDMGASGTALSAHRDGTLLRLATATAGSGGLGAQPAMTGTNPSQPAVAVAPNGAGLVVFADGPASGGPGGIPGPRTQIRAGTGVAGGFFGVFAESTISLPGGEVSAPVVDIGDGGTAVVVWQEFRAGLGDLIRVARRPPGAATFDPPVTVGAGSDPVAVVGANDGVTVAWTGGGGAVFTAVSPSATAPFGSPTQLSDGVASAPALAAGSTGTRALVAWRETSGGVARVQTAIGVTGQNPVQDPGSPIDAPDGVGDLRAATGGGVDLVVWRGTDARIRGAVRDPDDDDFDDPQQLSPDAGSASALDAAAGDEGSLVVTWVQDAGGAELVQARVRVGDPGGSGAAFGPATPLSSRDSVTTDVASAPDGSSVVIWQTSSGGTAGATTANLPSFRSGPAVSGTATVGAPLTCTVRAVRGDAPDFRWVRDDGTVVATTAQYSVAPADAGHALTCGVVVTNDFGSVTSFAPPVAVPAAPSPPTPPAQTVTVTAPAPPAQVVTVTTPASPPTAGAAAPSSPALRALPRITGRARVGTTLRCTPAAFTGATRVSTTWLRGKAAIRGATKTRYRLTRRDRGKVVACRTTATGPGGATTALSLGVLVKR